MKLYPSSCIICIVYFNQLTQVVVGCNSVKCPLFGELSGKYLHSTNIMCLVALHDLTVLGNNPQNYTDSQECGDGGKTDSHTPTPSAALGAFHRDSYLAQDYIYTLTKDTIDLLLI